MADMNKLLGRLLGSGAASGFSGGLAGELASSILTRKSGRKLGKMHLNREAIQTDIFDHILAVVPEFDLRVYQNPTGADFRMLNA